MEWERDFRHLIGGELESSEEVFEVIDPSKGTAFATCPQASRRQLDKAVQSARCAQPGWNDIGAAARREHLHRMAECLAENELGLATLLVREQGKPIARAREEIQRSAGLLKALSSMEVPVEVVRDDEQGRVEMYWRPLGVVGAITPWNVPIVLAVSKIVQALAVGNTIVVKPSPYTPLTLLMIGELAQDVLPAGVLNILAGGNEFGAWMTAHPGIDKISFTGSVATGKRVMASCADSLKRLTLELGGNDAAIVLPDLDVTKVASEIFWAAFNNSGQVCMAIKRLYVHEDIYEAMVNELARLARSVVIGDGLDPRTTIGPLQNEAQYKQVLSVIEEARSSPGARIAAGGGAVERAGYFIEPTIVADIAEGCRLVDEEQFGPVLPVLRYRDIDEVVARANKSKYGLGGSVWSDDLVLAESIAARLQAGTTWINHHLKVDPEVPFGGIKQSGLGVEYSLLGLKAYMDLHVVRVPNSI